MVALEKNFPSQFQGRIQGKDEIVICTSVGEVEVKNGRTVDERHALVDLDKGLTVAVSIKVGNFADDDRIKVILLIVDLTFAGKQAVKVGNVPKIQNKKR